MQVTISISELKKIIREVIREELERFKVELIPEEEPEPEDLEALKIATEQYKEGKYVTWEELEKELSK